MERPLSGDSRERVSKVSKRDILKAMSINDMVKSIDEDKGEESMSWGELANLTHATQVERFNWCSCEDNEGRENPYTDCPKEVEGE